MKTPTDRKETERGKSLNSTTATGLMTGMSLEDKQQVWGFSESITKSCFYQALPFPIEDTYTVGPPIGPLLPNPPTIPHRRHINSYTNWTMKV